jgi:hypothetical protein
LKGKFFDENQMAQGFIMCIIPNDDYIISDAMKSSMNYYSMPSNFSGSIVYYNLDGAFNNAWKYEQGKLQEGLIPEKQSQRQVKGIAIFEIRRCNNIYTGPAGDMEYQYTHCWTEYQHVDIIDGFEAPGPEDEPKDDDENVLIPIGYLGGGTGSTGNTGGNPPNKLDPKDPCASVARINTKLPEKYIERLRQLREEAKTSTEHGTAFYTDGTRTDRSGKSGGGSVGMWWDRNRVVDLFVHNHTKRESSGGKISLTSPCFSATDIGVLHQMIIEKETQLSANFIFMVIHDEATYIVQIDDMTKFINSNFSVNAKDFYNNQQARFQEDVDEFQTYNSGWSPPIDKFSRKGFLDLFGQYGISLMRSTNSSSKDFTQEDKWHHLTKEQPNPRNSKNLIDPCND